MKTLKFASEIYWPLAVLWVGLMWYCKLAQQHIITVVYPFRKGVGWIICYKSVWLDAGFENWNSQWGQIFKMFTLAFYLPRFFFSNEHLILFYRQLTIQNSNFPELFFEKIYIYLFDWLKNFNVTKIIISTNQSLLLTHCIWQIQLWCPRSKWNMGEILAFLA